MRHTTLLFIALLLLPGFPSAVQGAISAQPVEIERSTPPSKSHDRKSATSSVPAGKTNSFSFSTGTGSTFNFDGGWDRNGFRFRMDPEPKALLKQLWLSPFELLSGGWRLSLWLAGSLAIAALFGPHLRRAHEELCRAPGRSVAIGVVWGLAFRALLVACALLCLVAIGIPMIMVLVAFNWALGVFGMAVIFLVAGEWLARRLNQSAVSIYVAILVGACAFGLLRMLPFFGSVIWLVAGLFGTGAALAALSASLRSTGHGAPALIRG